MKQIIPIMLVFALLLCGCEENKENSAVSEMSVPAATELALQIIDSCGREEDSVRLINESYDADAMVGYVQAFYGLSRGEWTDCAVYRAQAADDAFEISVFKLAENTDISAVFNSLEQYRRGRQGDFFGYNPAQAKIVDNGLTSLSADGRWAAIFICDDPGAADKVFFECLGMSLPEEEPESAPSLPEIENDPVSLEGIGELPSYWTPYADPEVDDMSLWDNGALVSAIKSGSDAQLDEQGKELFKKVNKVIGKIIRADMSPLEKERAVYKWLCESCEYDYRHYEIPNAAPRESYEPYGAIVKGEAVCLGYATAFQLFMDVLDIECITVVGAAFSSREDHAWNMVNIDSEWYCVDTTWDTGMPDKFFAYFNVSSEYMALTDHQWDYEAYPVALPEETGNGLIHK